MTLKKGGHGGMHVKLGRLDFDKLGAIAGVSVRRSQSGKLCRLRESLSIILLFLILSAVPTHSDDRDPAKNLTSPVKKILYQVFEKHMFILGEVTTAGTDKETLDEAKRKGLRNELAGIDTSLFWGEEKKDLDEWRDLLVGLLDKLPSSAFDSGSHSWQLLKKCMAVLANHDITGAMAKEDGYPQLSEKIDAVHDMAKGILLILCRQDTKALQEVSPVARAFVEYFHIFSTLAGSKNRDPVAQSALLSMKPGEMKEQTVKTAFLDLHKSLLLLSHGRSGKSEPYSGGAGIDGKLPLVFFCDIMKKASIQDAEIKKTNADEKLLTVVRQLREIGKGDKCGKIVP
jgi:hypothetical protein